MVLSDRVKEQTVPMLVKFMTAKIDFWNKVKGGFASLDEFAAAALDFSKIAAHVKKTFTLIVEGPKFREVLASNAIIIKVTIGRGGVVWQACPHPH